MITLKFGDKYKFEASYDELVDRTTLPLGDEDEREVELPWSSGLGWALQYVLELRNEEGEDNYEEKWNDFCDLPFTAKKLILDVEEHFYFKYR
jgi:hypothetical protein